MKVQRALNEYKKYRKYNWNKFVNSDSYIQLEYVLKCWITITKLKLTLCVIFIFEHKRGVHFRLEHTALFKALAYFTSHVYKIHVLPTCGFGAQIEGVTFISTSYAKKWHWVNITLGHVNCLLWSFPS